MAGDVLSQSEIDALLSAISTGEMSADDMKKEDEAKRQEHPRCGGNQRTAGSCLPRDRCLE